MIAPCCRVPAGSTWSSEGGPHRETLAYFANRRQAIRWRLAAGNGNTAWSGIIASTERLVVPTCSATRISPVADSCRRRHRQVCPTSVDLK